MRLRLCLFGFLFVPVIAFGQKKEVVELGRDVAALQDQVRALQASSNEKMAALTALVQQLVEANNTANKTIGALDARVNDRLEKQTASVGQPVAVIGAKVDQMSSDFQSVRESLNDLGARIGRIDQKLVDLNNAFRTIQAPPSAPTAASPTGASAAPAIPAQALYENAYRDKMSGKSDLALKGFSDYIQMYADTDLAPNAQYWIGQIHYEQNDLENAVKDFDAVVEKYPASNKTADALFMKGQSLVKLNRPTAGVKEFRAVLASRPSPELGQKACAQLKMLGHNCSVPASAPVAKKKQ